MHVGGAGGDVLPCGERGVACALQGGADVLALAGVIACTAGAQCGAYVELEAMCLVAGGVIIAQAQVAESPWVLATSNTTLLIASRAALMGAADHIDTGTLEHRGLTYFNFCFPRMAHIAAKIWAPIPLIVF